MRRRLVVMLVLLAGCDLYFGGTHRDGGGGGGGGGDDDGPWCAGPAPSDNCVCTKTVGWACNTCPFDEGDGPVSCTPGASCELETWEHGCSCTCNANGWWACEDETIGTHCPEPPDGDGGVPPPPQLDAGFPDAPA